MVPESPPPRWTLLTNHARVLICIADDPAGRLREIAERVGITERAVHRIVVDLRDAGYIIRERDGRRNRYTIRPELPIHDPLARDRGQTLGQLLRALAPATEPRPCKDPETTPPTGAQA